LVARHRKPPALLCWTCLAAFLSAANLVVPSMAQAGPDKSPLAIDLALVVAVDVSSSMDKAEQRVQRQGYVSALRDPDVLQAIGSGRRGRIAIVYVEWARSDYQHVVMPWTVIERPEDATSFADALDAQPIASEMGTSISGALLAAAKLLETTSLRSDRQVIDVSGDGPNNAGIPVAPVRDALIAQGVIINGLAISLPPGDASGRLDSFGEHYIETYYEGCVIGGPGSFVIAVSALSDFERAIRRKFVFEISGLPPRVQLAAHQLASNSIDCMPTGFFAR
jgi:Protein of unknown function (DUF1194)